MARIRTIKPEFFRHETLYEAEVSSGLPLRLAFAGLFTVADREGRFKWAPRVLKLDVLPFDDVDFVAVLEELAACGFVVKYQVGAEMYGHIPTWAKHQHINQREADSSIPSPDEAGARTCEIIPARGEGKGREQEGERETLSLRSSDAHADARDAVGISDAIETEFSQTFWLEYPNKVGKPAALKAFRATRKRAALERIMAGLERYKLEKPPDRQWLNPATFLNQDRFDDQPASTKPAAKPNAHDSIFRALAAVAGPGTGANAERSMDGGGERERDGATQAGHPSARDASAGAPVLLEHASAGSRG